MWLHRQRSALQASRGFPQDHGREPRVGQGRSSFFFDSAFTTVLMRNGAYRVVTIETNTMTEYVDWAMMSMFRPIIATTMPTSPLGTIPAPTMRAVFSPRVIAPREHPISFERMATTVTTMANGKTFVKFAKSTRAPMTTKKNGTSSMLRGSTLLSRREG